jgi:hypothetical protein
VGAGVSDAEPIRSDRADDDDRVGRAAALAHPGARYSSPTGAPARQGRQPARRVPGHGSAGDVCPDTAPPVSRTAGPRAAGRTHRRTRAPHRVGDLHEYRHSSLTHLGEAGASTLMLRAKSRHKKSAVTSSPHRRRSPRHQPARATLSRGRTVSFRAVAAARALVRPG